MATRTQGFDAVSAGAAPASGNTTNAGDTAVTTTLTPGTGTVTLVGTTTAGEVIDSVASAKLVATGNAAGFVSQNMGGATVGSLGCKRRWPAAPVGANCSIMVIRNTGGRSASVTLLTSGKVKVSTNSADLYTTPSALSFPGIYYVSVTVDTGSTAGNDGKIKFGVYDASGALTGGMTASQEFTSLANVGAGLTLSTAQMGKTDPGVLTATYTDFIDTVVSTDSYVLNLPPGGGNTAPTLTVGGVQNITGSTASVTASATDTGSVASFSCTLQSSSGASNPTIGTGVVVGAGTTSASVTYPITGLVAGQHKFSVTATDNLGLPSATGTATVNVTSASPGIRSVTAGAYTVIGGGTAAQALQAGTPSTRYLQSPAPPAGASGAVAFQPGIAAAVPWVFGIVGHASDGVTSLTRTVYLKQSGTIIATRSGTVGTTDTTIGGTTTTTPSGGETALITDHSALTVEWATS